MFEFGLDRPNDISARHTPYRSFCLANCTLLEEIALKTRKVNVARILRVESALLETLNPHITRLALNLRTDLLRYLGCSHGSSPA